MIARAQEVEVALEIKALSEKEKTSEQRIWRLKKIKSTISLTTFLEIERLLAVCMFWARINIVSSEHMLNLFFSHSYRASIFGANWKTPRSPQREGLIADWHRPRNRCWGRMEERNRFAICSRPTLSLARHSRFHCLRLLLERGDQEGVGAASAGRGARDPGNSQALLIGQHAIRWAAGGAGKCEASNLLARQDEAFEDVAVAIKRAVEDMRGDRSGSRAGTRPRNPRKNPERQRQGA